MVLFKSNWIILRHYLGQYLVLKTQANKRIWKCLFNIGIGANIVDQDQTAPTGAVWSGSTLFIYEASNNLVEDKNIQFVIMRLKGE